MTSKNWQKIKLGDLLNFRRGHDLPKTEMINGVIPVIGSNGIIGYHNEYTTKAPCLIIGRSGNIGNPYYLNEDCWAHNTTLYVDDFKGNDPKYLYYLLKTLNLGYYGGGSAVPTLNRNHIHPIEVNATSDVYEQESIANTLSCLDGKIEINNRINKNLEEMAQAIFKRWFVDFEFPDENGNPYKSSGGEMVEREMGYIPKRWEIGILGDLLDNIKNPEKAGEHIKNIPYLPIECIPMNSLSLNEYKPGEEAKSSLIRFSKDDILVGAMRIYFHRVVLAPFDGITRTTCFVLRPKHKYMTPFTLLLCNLDSTIEYAQNTSQGSTMPYAVWDGGLQKLKVIVPNKEILVNFYKIISPLIEQIRDSLFEKNTLAVIRNSLLPKLMSGEIRVPCEEAV